MNFPEKDYQAFIAHHAPNTLTKQYHKHGQHQKKRKEIQDIIQRELLLATTTLQIQNCEYFKPVVSS